LRLDVADSALNLFLGEIAFALPIFASVLTSASSSSGVRLAAVFFLGAAGFLGRPSLARLPSQKPRSSS
jgi:hypothetical protein